MKENKLKSFYLKKLLLFFKITYNLKIKFILKIIHIFKLNITYLN